MTNGMTPPIGTGNWEQNYLHHRFCIADSRYPLNRSNRFRQCDSAMYDMGGTPVLAIRYHGWHDRKKCPRRTGGNGKKVLEGSRAIAPRPALAWRVRDTHRLSGTVFGLAVNWPESPSRT